MTTVFDENLTKFTARACSRSLYQSRLHRASRGYRKLKKTQKIYNIFWFFWKTTIKLDAIKAPLAGEGDFDTGNRSPLVLGAKDLQKPSKIHVKIWAPRGWGVLPFLPSLPPIPSFLIPKAISECRDRTSSSSPLSKRVEVQGCARMRGAPNASYRG